MRGPSPMGPPGPGFINNSVHQVEAMQIKNPYYMEDDLLFPSNKQARSDYISNLENHVEETIHVYSEKNKQTSDESVQDYELLKASLRSRLVERFGKKQYLNNAAEATEQLTTGKVFETEHQKLSAYMGPPLQEADENVMTNAEGTMVLANDRHEKIANSCNALSMGNCDPEGNISSLGELCMPLGARVRSCFTPSMLTIGLKHVQCGFYRQ
ncbi:hypothetical protein ABZP36_019748 [Zizania latifolia]